MKHMLCVLLVAALFTVPVAGDVLVTTSGKAYEGKLISRTDAEVVFEVHLYGNRFEKTFSTGEVAKIEVGKMLPKEEPKPGPETSDKLGLEGVGEKPNPPEILKYDKPTYYVIPLEGEVGKTLTAKFLKEALDDAAQRKPDVVILEVDSPGGLISEVAKLGELIQETQREMRLVVYVREAISAAAITSMAVREIHMQPGSTIGAATAWKVGEDGMPEAIAEKFQSYWRAAARSLTEVGGHEPLLAEAMIDASVQLYLETQNGKPKVLRGDGNPVIIPKGKLLTLTAGEALRVGLADSVSDGYAELGKALGMENWVECKGLARDLARWQSSRLSEAEKTFTEQFKEFHKNIDLAIANHPKNGDYIVYSGTNGLFTPASRKKWKNRTRKSIAYLVRCGKNLDQLTALAEEFPGLQQDPDQIKEARAKVEEMRADLYANFNQSGMRD